MAYCQAFESLEVLCHVLHVKRDKHDGSSMLLSATFSFE